MNTLESHLAVDVDWLAASDSVEATWAFGPGPPLTNLPTWVSQFASFDARILMRATLAASNVSAQAWHHPTIQTPDELAFVERLPFVRRWINRDADEHPAWLSQLGNKTFAMDSCDTEFYDWSTKSYNAADWAYDSALHCLLTLNAIMREHGRQHRTYAITCVVAAMNSFRCADRNWAPAVSCVVRAIQAEFGA